MEVRADTAAESARVALQQVSVLFGWAPALALVPVGIAGLQLPETYRYLPLVASAILFGMPHGAVDYVALPRARTGRVDLRGVAVVVLLYLLLGGAYLALWFLAPVPAAGLFVLVTWFHWGQGDLYVLRDLFGAVHVADRQQGALTVLVRGGLPMLVPLLGFPGRYRDVLGTFVDPFGGSVEAWRLFDQGPRVVLGAVFAGVTLLTLARGYRHVRGGAPDESGLDTRDGDARRGWRLDAAETVLLWGYFLLVPPLLAIGVYFCLWHSLRHIARVVLLDGTSVEALSRGQWLLPTGKFALEAAVPTALALGIVGALWAATPSTVSTLAGATGLYLVVIAVLTLPHTAVVVWLDREQGIWSFARPE